MDHKKPNILLLFTDMQRADTIHALGNETIKTPHLDRLVSEGTTFTNCFSPSPVCCPARCCLQYGLYPQKTGLFDNGPMMADNGASYPALLGQNGYKTHAVGKCHFTPDKQAMRGFHSRRTQEECTADPTSDHYIAWLRENGFDDYEAHGARGEMYYIPQVSTLPAEAHPTQWVGDESINFIQAKANGRQPWMLFSSYIHPHPPFAPPKPWHKLYRLPDMPQPFIPDESESLYTWVNRHQNRYKYRDNGRDMNLLRLITAYYYATISFVDYQIGRILQTLEESNQLDNTMIIFASDHGEHLGDLGCFGKRSMQDASARVPLIVRYPKRFPVGERCEVAVSLCDLSPTMLGSAEVPIDQFDLDGTDLAHVVTNPDPARVVYSQFAHAERAIYMAVNQHYKYVYSAGDGKEFFFDRQADPNEIKNLAGAADGPQNELKQNLLAYLKSVNATEAYSEESSMLRWREYPRIDESYLADPDARLLVQDYPSYPTDLPGYSTT